MKSPRELTLQVRNLQIVPKFSLACSCAISFQSSNISFKKREKYVPNSRTLK
ncbi:hypothetical protein HanXRQr2_Chr01g0012701 [Helianthus annuus]|uniref:Uncharacterized protein n=1 Tax=Helianthus annuus TaxID=4232 RepID=A0A9K3P2T9_HELAN|nr:hypothetical protein HanXRQr2_Chr01g0012701 [Helianthus annuus]